MEKELLDAISSNLSSSDKLEETFDIDRNTSKTEEVSENVGGLASGGTPSGNGSNLHIMIIVVTICLIIGVALGVWRGKKSVTK